MQSPLVYYPNDLLKQRAEEVREFSGNLKTLSEHMRQVMKDYAGMGLAAPQVGQSIRLIAVEYQPAADDTNPAIPFTVMINPEIIKTGKETDWLSEGCLSIPFVEVNIERATEVSVAYQDLDGKKHTIHAKGLFARIVQHEVDHLNGTLILDYEKPVETGEKPRVIFWGSTSFSTEVMNVIRPHVTTVAIVTEPAKPSGRKAELTPTIAKRYADTLGITVVEPYDLADPRLYTYLLSLKPDIMIVAAYGRLIPQSLYDLPLHGTLNVHPSMLPKYRGATPIQAAILAGDAHTGVTIMKLSPEFDTGDIIAQAPYELTGHETYGDLEYALAEMGGEVLKEILPEYLAGQLESIPQSEANIAPSGTKKITLESRWLNMNDPAEMNYRKIRAYSPAPSAFIILDKQMVKVLEAHIEENTLVFDTVQPAGKKPMPWADFLRGYRKELQFSDLNTLA